MSLIWDPPKTLFTLPTGHEIRLYGLLFAVGAWIAWLLIRRAFEELLVEQGEEPSVAKKNSVRLLDRLTWPIIILIVLGAKLVHLLFYDLDYFLYDPLSLFRIWEPGLASHGGTAGGFIAVGLFWFLYKKSFINASFLQFFDRFLPPIAVTSAFIRLGNFFNQEILGTPTTLPWGVTFLHPVDGGEILSRHPVQLYEAFLYLGTFFLLTFLGKKRSQPGYLSGLFFLTIFGGRSLLEFWKDSQNGIYDGLFSTGQLLSLPLIILGLLFIYTSKKTRSFAQP